MRTDGKLQWKTTKEEIPSLVIEINGPGRETEKIESSEATGVHVIVLRIKPGNTETDVWHTIAGDPDLIGRVLCKFINADGGGVKKGFLKQAIEDIRFQDLEEGSNH